jgi:hypothetical protein
MYWRPSMKVFVFKKDRFAAVVKGFNRGHAVKLLAKELEHNGLILDKKDPLTEIDIESEKGEIFVISSGDDNGSKT